MDDLRPVYAALEAAAAASEPVALATVIAVRGSVPRHVGSKLLVYAGGSIVGTVGGGALESLVIAEGRAAIVDGEPRLRDYALNDLAAGDPGICGGTVSVFIEPIVPAPTLLVIGGGHVGRALAGLGKLVGWRVVLSDDRPDYCRPQDPPGLDGYIVCPPADLPARMHIDERTYIAAVTRGLSVDRVLIPALLATDAPYIGVIGSRRRWVLTAQALIADGIDPDSIARLRAPIGLELNAETPAEIAVSIVAEIIMLRRGGTGVPMRWSGSYDALSVIDDDETSA